MVNDFKRGRCRYWSGIVVAANSVTFIPQVNIWNLGDKLDMSRVVRNSEFDLVDSKVIRNITMYDCCIEPYPDVTVRVNSSISGIR